MEEVGSSWFIGKLSFQLSGLAMHNDFCAWFGSLNECTISMQILTDVSIFCS